jgi:hypothetical protein
VSVCIYVYTYIVCVCVCVCVCARARACIIIIQRKERERAEAEERECKRLEELEERERRERARREQERLERERQEREHRERKMAEVQVHGRAAVGAVMEALGDHNLGAAHQALQSLKTFHLAESLFVTEELRGEEQRVSDAVRALEKEHARVYNERRRLIELGQAHLDSAHTAMKGEDLGVARELVCASLEALADAAAPCVFVDISERLKPRIDSDIAQAQELQQEVVVRVSCMDKAEQLLQECNKFSKVLYIVTLYSKYTWALTFENLCRPRPPGGGGL